MKRLTILVLSGMMLAGALSSCTTVDLYEKTVSIPHHQWKSNYKPNFTFSISDTSSPYQVFLILRHSEKYNFKNIYINLHAGLPGQDSAIVLKQDLALTNDKGWDAEGMDDIYEHRIKLGDPQTLKKGTYTFTLEQIMREDPLEHVFNVGIRVEKK